MTALANGSFFEKAPTELAIDTEVILYNLNGNYWVYFSGPTTDR